MSAEIQWLPVVGREKQYEVSSEGQVRDAHGRILGQWANNQGYILVRLSKPRQTVRVHRLVAAAHLPNPKRLPFVNHIDFQRSNNAAENLEWCTQWENLHHSEIAGRMQRNYWSGRRSPNAGLDDEKASAIRAEYSEGGISWAALGQRYGISKRSVGRIVRGESYV